MPLLLALWVFAFGSAVGSFLNVCIYRIPAGESVVSPPSRCPNCHASIRWYQNIPVVSFLALGGRCASCRILIPWRYPFVELLTGVLFVVVVWIYGWSLPSVAYCLLVAILVTVSFIDLDHRIIPDRISLPGIVVGFACSFMIPWLRWSDSLLGIVLGGGSLYLVAASYALLAKREGMGGGDIKLLALIGAFLGWKSILPVIFIGSLAGSIVGIPLMVLSRAGRHLALPFGPFLSLGAFVYLSFWSQIINFYFHII